ncbi:MAG TPA: hypothetical protein VKR81_14490, partial [Candidatus Binatia bacterium]|nr:hypothetical protein [Candidatus Binatia bacterium]
CPLGGTKRRRQGFDSVEIVFVVQLSFRNPADALHRENSMVEKLQLKRKERKKSGDYGDY